MKKINLIFLLLLGTIFLTSCDYSNYNDPFKEGVYETDEIFNVVNNLKITKSDGTVKEFGDIAFTKLKISFVEISEEEYNSRDKNVMENRYDYKKYLVEIYVKINDSEYLLANYQKCKSYERDMYPCELELDEYFGEKVVVGIDIWYRIDELEIWIPYSSIKVNGEYYPRNFKKGDNDYVHIPFNQEEVTEK